MTTELAIYKTLVKAFIIVDPAKEQLWLVFSDGTKMFYNIESLKRNFDDVYVDVKFLGVNRS